MGFSFSFLRLRVIQKTKYKTADGLTVYDLDPQAAELWAVAGPDGFVGEIDPDDLPDGFRWVDGWEWETLNEVDYSEVAGKVFSLDPARIQKV